MFDGTSTLASVAAHAATDLRTARSGSFVSRSSSPTLIAACFVFFSFFQSLTTFFRRITAAIWRTAGFADAEICFISAPTHADFFRTGFSASSAARICVVSGAVNARSTASSCASSLAISVVTSTRARPKPGVSIAFSRIGFDRWGKSTVSTKTF